MKRSRLRPVSRKTRAQRQPWASVTAQVRARSGGRCEVRLELAELLDTVQWGRFSLDTIRRKTEYRCVMDRRDTHHVKKRSQGGSDDPRNLLDVCRACHNWFDAAGESKSGRLMAEPSTDPAVAPRTWIERRSKFEARAEALGRALGGATNSENAGEDPRPARPA